MRYIRDFPKSVYFNYRCLSKAQARKLPIHVKWNTKLGILEKNSIIINSEKIERSMITLGYRGGQFISADKSYFSISDGGKVIFNGICNFGEGFNIAVEGGTVSFGGNFYANRNLQIECQKEITFGNDVLLGWNVKLRDTDGHSVIHNGTVNPYVGEITVGSHVWIASDTTVLKNSKISTGSVIACNSTVCGLKSDKENLLIGGTPAKVIKENVEWIE